LTVAGGRPDKKRSYLGTCIDWTGFHDFLLKGEVVHAPQPVERGLHHLFFSACSIRAVIDAFHTDKEA
jgi:hypothetical protein